MYTRLLIILKRNLRLAYYLYFTCSAFSCVHTLDNTNGIHLFTIPTKCQNQSENRGHSPA